MNTPQPIRKNAAITVMLVDDSAIIRGALSRIIEKDPVIQVVSSVMNGELAVSAAATKKPDIVILDVEMPVMDGLTALPKIIESSPKSKVIMFSALTERGAEVSIKALSLGAVECIGKPSSAQDVGEGSDFEQNLISIIKGLAPRPQAAPPVNIASSAAPKTSTAQNFTLHENPHAYTSKPAMIAIGSSTGGPQALFEVIKNFKGFDIPIVVTQHMPATFTKMLAQHIENNTGLPAREGEHGMMIENGHVYIAPGGFHMLIEKSDEGLHIKIDDGPPENFCKPSVDPMFRSVIDIYGQRVLGVILTGMGNDGLPSAKTLVEKNGRVIAQDEETSVVWGMPGAVAQAGICSKVLPLNQIGPWVKQAVLGK